MLSSVTSQILKADWKGFDVQVAQDWVVAVQSGPNRGEHWYVDCVFPFLD